MITAPLHERIAGLQAALATGAPVEPYGATVDKIRGLVTMRTARGPAYFHLRDLATIARATAPTIVDPPTPLPPAAPIRPKVATKAAFKVEPLPSWSAHRIPLEKAPKRAVGNFSTAELRQRTIDELRQNLATAQANGCDALAKVMADALAVAVARPVDVNGVIQKPRK